MDAGDRGAHAAFAPVRDAPSADAEARLQALSAAHRVENDEHDAAYSELYAEASHTATALVELEAQHVAMTSSFAAVETSLR